MVGTQGMKISGVEHDFKVGGKWKFSMLMPDGNAFYSQKVDTGN